MTTAQVAAKLVELCQQGKNMEAIQTLYSPEIVTVEAMGDAQMPREMKGLDAVHAKAKWWFDNHEVHGGKVDGPFPHGDDKFACIFEFDVTPKATQQRTTFKEVAVYTVKAGKIVHEEFYYSM